MSSTKILLSLCLVAFVAACAGTKEEVVYVDEPAVTVEPTFHNKYE